MKKSLLIIASLTCAMNSSAFYECRCELEFNNTETGELYTEEVSTNCPEAESSFDLSCDGDEFAGSLTSTCSHNSTGESESNSGWTQWGAEATSPWPSCSVW